jgi:penicillin-binding protein 1A
VLGSPHKGPIGIAEIQCPRAKCHGKSKLVASPHLKRVLPPEVASTIHELLRGVVTSGTGQSAQISGVDVVGKTGTTTDEGDAWFVGWTPQFTTAVWVGFPNRLVPMLTQFNGGPVTGGTFPAEIWRAYMESALQINAEEHPPKPGTSSNTQTTGADTNSTYTYAPGTATAPATTTPTPTAAQTTPAPTVPQTTPTPAPTTPAPTTPAPTPTTPAPTTPAPTPTNPTGTTPSGGAGAG